MLVAIGVYYAMTWIAGGTSNPAVMLNFGANLGPLVATGDLWRLVASIFLHWNLLHLGLNAYALYFLGRNLEAFYGAWAFLVIFILAGVGGSTASAVFDGRISAGASGGVFGLLGASLVFAWKYRGLLPPRVTRIMGTALLPWVILNLGIGALIPAIDHAAHLGGLVCGAVLAALVQPAALLEARGLVSRTPRILVSITLSLLVVSAMSAGANILRLRGPNGPLMDPRAVAALSIVDAEFALELADREIADHPDDPSLRLTRAQLHGIQRNWEAAIADYRTVIAMAPTEHLALNNLAWLLLEEVPVHLRNIDEAESLARRAVAAAPGDPYARGTLGTVLLRRGQPEAALEELRGALLVSRPTRDEATDRYLMSIALHRLGRAEEARVVLDDALNQDPANDYRDEAESEARASTHSVPAP